MTSPLSRLILAILCWAYCPLSVYSFFRSCLFVARRSSPPPPGKNWTRWLRSGLFFASMTVDIFQSCHFTSLEGPVPGRRSGRRAESNRNLDQLCHVHYSRTALVLSSESSQRVRKLTGKCGQPLLILWFDTLPVESIDCSREYVGRIKSPLLRQRGRYRKHRLITVVRPAIFRPAWC